MMGICRTLLSASFSREKNPKDLLSHRNARSNFIRDVVGGLARAHAKRSQMSRLSNQLRLIVQVTENRIFKVTQVQPRSRSTKCSAPKKKKTAADVKSPQYLGLIGTLSVLFVIVDGLLWVLISYARMRSQENEERARREAERERTPAQRAPLADTTSVGSAASRRSPSSKPSLTSGSSSELFSSLLETSQ
ncbi:hypothetical protein RRG08_033033 [Elysia crispata]|uniref:Transmembrane protein n=1 Tax=Elysia crispata TaxID=231223 RepID=A0AAE1A7D8_9GAST|nr:hypothetical protein RRG08_033033 [Elysia crispata]